MKEATKVSPQDCVEVVEYVRGENKRHEKLVRVAEALERIGSIANAEKEVQARLDEAHRKLAEQNSKLEAAEQAIEKARQEASGIIVQASAEREQIIDEAKRKAQTEVAKIDSALQTKRGELAAISERLNKAQALIG